MVAAKSHRPSAAANNDARESDLFDLAPVSLWLEDYSGIFHLFEGWRRDGVSDIRAYFREDPSRVAVCSAAIKVIKVNPKTLALFEARSQEHLVENLALVFRDDMFDTHVEELGQLWDGGSHFSSHTVNYTMSGRRLDIQLNGSILPGHEADWSRVLVSIEDVTGREMARRELAQSEAYARGLFQYSPISLWVEDFGAVKTLMDGVRANSIVDFRVFTDVHPEFVERCMSEIRVLDVNSHTLSMFKAPDKATLLTHLSDIFRDDMRAHFREQLVDLWEGRLFMQREVVNYALDGAELNVHLQFSVFPGHELDWGLVLVALTDITARKKAEAYLEFLGKHDVITRLYNRSFYADELNRLERRHIVPVTIVVIDLNGLKDVNDELGHAAGDALLRRFGEVLTEAAHKPDCAARIGGDEFAIILPGGGEEAGQSMMENVEKLVDINNQFYGGAKLSLSMGAATGRAGERLEAVFTRADRAMYASKRAYYSDVDRDRRQGNALIET